MNLISPALPKRRRTDLRLTMWPLAATALFATTASLHAGPLNPPAGAIASTNKTLTEVEPRIAINLTNTPGDADSLFKITQPGSYYLTGNLTGVDGKHGIKITADGVTIDLSGFELVGFGRPGVVGSFDGIRVDTFAHTDIAIRGGTVRAWPGSGINLSSFSPTQCTITDVRARNNGNDGIAVGSSSRVVDCTATSNTGDGIQTSFDCVVTGCVASLNGMDGINGSVTNVITHCSAYQNGADGISGGINSTISDSTAYDNTDEGFVIGSSGTITMCAASANGGFGFELFFGSVITNCTSQINTLHGIFARDRCTISGNTCVRNGAAAGVGSGISITGDTGRIEGNTCTENDRGIEIIGARNIVIRNTCAGNSTANWDIAANNVCGPIVNRTAPASAAILGNSAPSSLGTTDANANFTH